MAGKTKMCPLHSRPCCEYEWESCHECPVPDLRRENEELKMSIAKLDAALRMTIADFASEVRSK